MREGIEALRHTVQQLERGAAALLHAIEVELERARHVAVAARAGSAAWRWN